MKSLKSLACVASVVAMGAVAQGATIAQWTFETSVPTTAGPHAAEVGTGNASAVLASSVAAFSNPAGNGSLESFSANNWAVNDYYQFTTSTIGLQTISFGLDHTSSNTGPRDFAVSYSVDGTVFLPLATYAVTNDSWGTVTNNPISTKGPYALPAAVDNLATVYVRVAVAGSTGVNGSPIATTGTSRVDNVTFSGEPIPEPASLSLLALGGLMLGRRRRA